MWSLRESTSTADYKLILLRQEWRLFCRFPTSFNTWNARFPLPPFSFQPVNGHEFEKLYVHYSVKSMYGNLTSADKVEPNFFPHTAAVHTFALLRSNSIKFGSTFSEDVSPAVTCDQNCGLPRKKFILMLWHNLPQNLKPSFSAMPYPPF